MRRRQTAGVTSDDVASCRATRGDGVFKPLPAAAAAGDLNGILQCINDGHALNTTVALRNQHGRLVCGVSGGSGRGLAVRAQQSVSLALGGSR